MSGIDANLYDILEALDIEYESTRHGISRMMRTFLKILSKHPKGITWLDLQDQYDHIFDTLDDSYYIGQAIGQLVEKGYITEYVGHFACMDTDSLYRYNPYYNYYFRRHTC